ncbi:hypothetical protein DNU06_17065 [Putridiphycobacter roseus]|uniref:Knr4/Smi1-like domain-containing protein n=1 Tax=Putridiphycobacter roseus TaxID=2219161 RepID=A0A2W1NJ32_9FLAO|nr:SMI1/KNR4 family protein [Putridiphycobacter roseus]PZE15632.1 hypothetical protein DNU06_17065 [Putridiphycobacter roseus]
MNKVSITFKTRAEFLPIFDEDLNDFETLIGKTLPTDYRQHMLVYNGGSVKEDIDHKNFPEGGGGISHLDAIKYGGENSMEEVFAYLGGKIPSGHISIGVCSSGGNILMDLNSGSKYGMTKWWNHDGYIVNLSPSFTGLLNDMVEPADEW